MQKLILTDSYSLHCTSYGPVTSTSEQRWQTEYTLKDYREDFFIALTLYLDEWFFIFKIQSAQSKFGSGAETVVNN